MAQVEGYCIEIVKLGDRQRVCWAGLIRSDIDINILLADIRPVLAAETKLKPEGVDFGN